MFAAKRPSFLIAGCLFLLCLVEAGCKSGSPGAPMGAMGVPNVSVIVLQPHPLALTTELPGRVAAYLTAEIRPQVSGIIKSRQFEEGALVQAGQVLYMIDSAPYEATLAQSKANLASAEASVPALQAKVDRYRDLLVIHAVGQQDYDDALSSLQQAQATVDSDKAAVETARINLSYTPIRSPITGRIGKSEVTVGGLVSAYQSTVLATVQQIEPVYVDVVQSNAELLRLRKALESGNMHSDGSARHKVKLYLEDGSLYPQNGTFEFQDVTVGTSTGSVTVRMTFPNRNQILLPGMYVRAVVEEGIKPNAILVPQQAVVRDSKGTPYAWVVNKEGKAERRDLELDRTVGNQWLVNTGLNPSDQVIVEGGDRVQMGMPVHAVQYQQSSGQPAQTSRNQLSVPANQRAGAHV
jgi:membrane fusion protein (multidrug efflux system)